MNCFDLGLFIALIILYSTVLYCTVHNFKICGPYLIRRTAPQFISALQFHALRYTSQVKVRIKLPLCLTKHHAMKTYWGSGGIAPLML